MTQQVLSPVRDEAQLRAAIAGFERILEVMPSDTQAIEALADAYLQIGDEAKACDHFARLAELIVAQRDIRGAEAALKKIPEAGGTPELHAARRQLQQLVEGEKQSQVRTSDPGHAPSAKRAIDITQEVALAWSLLQSKEIAQEDYSAIVHDLTENSMKMPDVPVTVLHALHDRAFPGLDRITAHLSKTSGMPYLTLSGIDVLKDTFALLPFEFVIRRGAMIFELMGADALAAVLNPFDAGLQEDVARISGRRCHFYLVSATDYDLVLNNMRKTQSPKA
jgi:tetratricopeptide (TPR) repeat protein